MKTLDEVIETAPYVGTEWTNNALHYLKEYRTEQRTLRDRKEHYEYWENKYYAELEKLEKNDSLTWDELKEMVGKPVWVEEKDMPSTWIIIWNVTKNWLYPTGCDAYRHEEYGKSWQVYRKERE